MPIRNTLLILSLVFGTSIGTLLLYPDYIGIGVVLLILTATVFVARREDLRELGRNRLLIALIVMVAVFVAFGSLSVYSIFGGSLFELLAITSFVLLIAYAILSRTGHGARTGYE